MALQKVKTSTFNNVFNLLKDELSRLEIKENQAKNNCLIHDKNDTSKYYNAFILQDNPKTKIICEVSFYKSSITSRYTPRPTFKKTDSTGEIKQTDYKKPVIIAFKESEQAIYFWRLIGFLNSFKDVVDLGEFEQSFQVVSKNAYFIEFANKGDREKVEEIKELILKADLKENDIKSITFENRKKIIKSFLFLIKNKSYHGKSSLESYKDKFQTQDAKESVWHHFLKKNDWILGLNVDIKFIRDLYDEQKVGIENSKGTGSPKTDLLGISDYTTLIELKHSDTNIFKDVKTSKSRTNTWDFTPDFIEGISQCLGQKFALDKSYMVKDFTDANGKLLDTNKIFTEDPKTILIIGNRKREFPHDLLNEHNIKSKTFELFRRNNRNIEIITFDELFERAYHIVFSEKVIPNWFEDDKFGIEI
jgi:hypothetical protein